MRSLIDEVQVLHDELWEGNGEYRLLFEAISDAGAQEGSVADDMFMAALVIREMAREDRRNLWLAAKKLAEVRAALEHVLQRERSVRDNTDEPELDE